MPTYSAPVQPPTQTQLVNFRRYNLSWYPGLQNNLVDCMTASGSSAPTGAVTGAIWAGGLPRPILATALYRDPAPNHHQNISEVTVDAYALSPLDASPYDANLGPLHAGTPQPADAIGWRLDPTDAAGDYVGDYQITMAWKLDLFMESFIGLIDLSNLPAGENPRLDNSLPPAQRPVLPAMTATLRAFPASNLQFTGSGATFNVSSWTFPGAPMPGTAVASATIPAGPGYAQTASPSSSGTLPVSASPIGLYVTLDALETASAPAEWYAHPPYYYDGWVAVANLSIYRSFRPQRYQWIYPDAEVTYPISEQRRTASSAFLGRRR